MLLLWLLLPAVQGLVSPVIPRPKSSFSSSSPIERGRLGNALPIEQVPIKSFESQWRILPDIWSTLARSIPDQTMLIDVISQPNEKKSITYSEAHSTITTLAAAFQKLGMFSGDCVSLFSENSHRWLMVDQAIMKAGGCNAVRGAQASVAELRYIYDNSGSIGLIVENEELLSKLYAPSVDGSKASVRSQSGLPKFIVILNARGASGAEIRSRANGDIGLETHILTYEELLSFAEEREYKAIMRDAESTATLVYTSGTTSQPKGVILRHRNILHQVTSNSFSIDFNSKKKRKPLGLLLFYHVIRPLYFKVALIPRWAMYSSRFFPAGTSSNARRSTTSSPAAAP